MISYTIQTARQGFVTTLVIRAWVWDTIILPQSRCLTITNEQQVNEFPIPNLLRDNLKLDYEVLVNLAFKCL